VRNAALLLRRLKQGKQQQVHTEEPGNSRVAGELDTALATVNVFDRPQFRNLDARAQQQTSQLQPWQLQEGTASVSQRQVAKVG
jgi:hypothetical protein